jgi:hypothetical protein
MDAKKKTKQNRKSTRDGKKLETKEIKTKPLIFLFALTFYSSEHWIFI